MERIGMSTVMFRTRFDASKPENMERPENELTLLDIPEYFADRYKLHNLEFWSLHFESLSKAYLESLRKQIEQSRSRLINIQFDGSQLEGQQRQQYNLADLDEGRRSQSIVLVKKWIDVAVAVGSPAVRANAGKGSPQAAIQSLKEINGYAIQKGIRLLVENHFGVETDPDDHIRIIKQVGPENCHTLPDFGNYPPELDRYSSLKKIMPYAYLVSAKVIDFDQNWRHTSFDFDRCMQIAEASGFRGIYSVEQWAPDHQPLDFYEKAADWAIRKVRDHLQQGS
jgi:sugar phosphate isomerase/epimerase